MFLENVKNLKNHDKGNTFRVIKETLEALGYRVYSNILNAKDFGLPQNRERIYIVAFLHNVVFSYPVATKEPTKLGNILESEVNSKYTISDNLWNYLQKRKQLQKEKGNGFGYSLFNHNSVYTSTISARYYKDGSEILIEQKNKNPRKLTPKEASKLQGFPEAFVIPVSDVQAYKQFGNSVPVNVVKQIAKRIIIALHTHNSLQKTSINNKIIKQIIETEEYERKN